MAIVRSTGSLRSKQEFGAFSGLGRAAFNKNVGSNGDVGIWHETYLVPSGQYESIYNNMPEYGLGKASTMVHAAGKRETARGRLGG